MKAEGGKVGRGLTPWLHVAREGKTEACRHLFTRESMDRWLILIGYLLPQQIRRQVDPHDILIEVLHQAWSDLRTLRDVSTNGFYRWVSTIARREVSDAVKRWTRGMRDARREVSLPTSELAKVAASIPKKSVRGGKRLEILIGLLNELPTSQREALMYCYLEARPRAEVAQALGITRNNLDVRMFRGLKRMRQLIEERGLRTTLFRPT